MENNYANMLPGVPNVESPFFPEIFAEGITDAEVFRIATDLNRDGFAILDFPDPDFDAVADRIISSLTESFDWSGWRGGQDIDLRTTNGWMDNDDIRRLAANEQMLNLLERLYGRRAFPFQTLNFPVGTQQHFHTDSLHFSSIPERFMVGVWVPLEDVGADQGPLIYYPGSHRWPIFTNEHIGRSFYEDKTLGNYGRLWERLVEVERVEPKRFLAKKGQAAIWAANLLHGGDAHQNRALTRWSQVNHYFFENCAYYTPLMSDPFAGSIYFRKPLNIVTGETVENFHNGRPVRPEFIAFTNPDTMDVAARPLPPGFDPAAYLELNPDVAAAGQDAAAHYREYGAREGRRYSKPDEIG